MTVNIEKSPASEPRQPVGKGRPDGAGGMVDDEGWHYPRAFDWRVYHRPQDEVGRNVKVGDVIQCSMPWSVSPSASPFGYSVFHFRARTLVGVHTIQTFADAVVEEFGQAFGTQRAPKGYRFGIVESIQDCPVVGPVHCVNLSSTGDEALSDTIELSCAGSSMPLRSAALVVKHTAATGRVGIGRWFLPLVSEQRQSAGRLDEQSRAFLEGAAADFANLNDLQPGGAGNFEMVVWSPTRSASMGAVVAYPVVSTSCHAVLSSVRDRVRVG